MSKQHICICPNHERYSKHACPCSLEKLNLSDDLYTANERIEKLKSELAEAYKIIDQGMDFNIDGVGEDFWTEGFKEYVVKSKAWLSRHSSEEKTK